MISPTVNGVQDVARRWKQGHTIAFPTECTYEVGMQLSVSDNKEELHAEVDRCLRGVLKLEVPYPTPHVYISGLQASSPSTLFLKRHLPERKYAFRKDGKVVSLHSFSESLHVLKRIAARIWPGPVILHVALGGGRPPTTGDSNSSTTADSASSLSDDHPSPSPTPPSPSPPPSPVLSGRSSSAASPQFLALRCPCHPLAVKVAQEYYKDSEDVLVGLALPLPPGNTTTSTTPHRSAGASAYVTSANDIVSGPNAVLHGEENLELFYVPPCEYGRPYGVSVWIDEGRRRITLRGSPHHIDDAPAADPDEAAGGGVCPVRQRPAQVTTRSLAHVLQQQPQPPTKPRTEKDRVIQAVLSKWVVDEEL